jgi:sulfur relay (sulfurtransferase) complex TusBCD TusD component (DsrE family)
VSADRRLGILIARPPSSPRCLAALALARAASEAGVRVDLFLTAEGVDLLATPGLLPREDTRVAVTVCSRSVARRGAPAGVAGIDYAGQPQLAGLLSRCDRFVSFC